MYPSASNWNSSDNDSAWIVRNSNGQQSACQTNGWNFLFDLQSQLKDRLSATPMTTWDGSTIDGSAIGINDPADPSSATGWNLPLLQALYAVAQADGAPGDALSSIQNDANTSSISPRTLATAVWVAEYNAGYVPSTGQNVYGQGSPNDITVPDGTMYPVFGQVPPVAAGGIGTQGQLGLDCHTITGFQGPPLPSVNPLLVIGLLAAGLVAIAVLTQDVAKPPAYATTVVSRRRSRRS